MMSGFTCLVFFQKDRVQSRSGLGVGSVTTIGMSLMSYVLSIHAQYSDGVHVLRWLCSKLLFWTAFWCGVILSV